ncbi:UTP18 family protein [Megaselia abdita]
MEKLDKLEVTNSKSSTSQWVKSTNEIQLETLLFHDARESFKIFDKSTSENKSKRKAVWIDEDESTKLGKIKKETKNTGTLSHLNDEIPYKEYLLNKFDKIGHVPKWANLNKNSELDRDEELTSIGFLQNTRTASNALQPYNLSFKRLKNINRDTSYEDESISSIQFHPTSTVALVSGSSGIATIHAIDGDENQKLHSIRFNGFSISCSKFYDGGSKVFFGGKQNVLFSYDLMASTEKYNSFPKNLLSNFKKFDISPCEKYLAVLGKFGEIHLLDLKSKEIIHTFKQEGSPTAIKFSGDYRIFTHSSSGNINILNARTNRVENTFADDGCLHGSCLDISNSGKLVASGSKEGVVNVYENVFTSSPKPVKSILNLTTAISDLKFNSTSEILGFCSESVPGAVKLFHCSTGTVFSNFPGSLNKLHKIKSIEFSPASGYMCLGSCKNEVPLFRLKHFNNY